VKPERRGEQRKKSFENCAAREARSKEAGQDAVLSVVESFIRPTFIKYCGAVPGASAQHQAHAPRKGKNREGGHWQRCFLKGVGDDPDGPDKFE